MKTKDQALLQPFRMRKKLSNSKHIHWIIAFTVAIGLGYLFILIEFVKMHDRKILFFNIKTANLETSSTSKELLQQKALFNNNSPIFLIYNNKIVFGNSNNVVLPNKKDNLVLSRKNFTNDFKNKISSYKHKKNFFPSKVIGISFQENIDYESQITLINDVFSIVKNENQKIDANEMNPSIVFVDTLPSSEGK